MRAQIFLVPLRHSWHIARILYLFLIQNYIIMSELTKEQDFGSPEERANRVVENLPKLLMMIGDELQGMGQNGTMATTTLRSLSPRVQSGGDSLARSFTNKIGKLKQGERLGLEVLIDALSADSSAPKIQASAAPVVDKKAQHDETIKRMAKELAEARAKNEGVKTNVDPKDNPPVAPNEPQGTSEEKQPKEEVKTAEEKPKGSKSKKTLTLEEQLAKIAMAAQVLIGNLDTATDEVIKAGEQPTAANVRAAFNEIYNNTMPELNIIKAAVQHLNNETKAGIELNDLSTKEALLNALCELAASRAPIQGKNTENQ